MQVLTGYSAADVSAVRAQRVGCHKGRWRNKVGLEVSVGGDASAVTAPVLMESVSVLLYTICLSAQPLAASSVGWRPEAQVDRFHSDAHISF